jgi:hypothetical protein
MQGLSIPALGFAPAKAGMKEKAIRQKSKPWDLRVNTKKF